MEYPLFSFRPLLPSSPPLFPSSPLPLPSSPPPLLPSSPPPLLFLSLSFEGTTADRRTSKCRWSSCILYVECPLFSRSLPLFARSFFKLWFWKIQLLIEGLRAQRKHGWAVLILILDTLQAKFGDWRLLRIPLWIKIYAWSYIDERAVVCSNGCSLCACVKAQLVEVDKGTGVNNSINTSSRVGGDKAGSQTTKR